jgi:hypothetical protein
MRYGTGSYGRFRQQSSGLGAAKNNEYGIFFDMAHGVWVRVIWRDDAG